MKELRLVAGFLSWTQRNQLHQEFRGGNSWWIRFKRQVFDAIVTLVNMYHGNPILTLLMFGLPLSFLALIVYSTCFSDILEAPDDEEADEEPANDHQKRD